MEDAGNDIYMYENIDGINPGYKCNVCLRPMIKPSYGCESEHMGCLKCLQGITACTICKTSYKTLHSSLALERLTEELKVHCSNFKNGCKVTMERDKFKDHIMYSCTMWACPFVGCAFKGTYTQLKEHTQNRCLLEPVKCVHGCNVLVPRRDMNAHRETCSVTIAKLAEARKIGTMQPLPTASQYRSLAVGSNYSSSNYYVPDLQARPNSVLGLLPAAPAAGQTIFVDIDPLTMQHMLAVMKDPTKMSEFSRAEQHLIKEAMKRFCVPEVEATTSENPSPYIQGLSCFFTFIKDHMAHNAEMKGYMDTLAAEVLGLECGTVGPILKTLLGLMGATIAVQADGSFDLKWHDLVLQLGKETGKNRINIPKELKTCLIDRVFLATNLRHIQDMLPLWVNWYKKEHPNSTMSVSVESSVTSTSMSLVVESVSAKYYLDWTIRHEDDGIWLNFKKVKDGVKTFQYRIDLLDAALGVRVSLLMVGKNCQFDMEIPVEGGIGVMIRNLK